MAINLVAYQWLSMTGIASSSDEARADGSTVETGAHLRWSIGGDLGFPQFGFDLFRREEDGPARIVCLDLRSESPIGSLDPKYLGKNEYTWTITYGTVDYQFTLRTEADAFSWMGGCCSTETPKGSLSIPGEATTEVIPPAGTRWISIWLEYEEDPDAAQAFYGDEVVDEAWPEIIDGQATYILQANRIDRVVFTGLNLRICEICVKVGDTVLKPDGAGGWTGWKKLNSERIHLPVTRPSVWPGSHANSPNDDREAEARLPDGLSADVAEKYIEGFSSDLHPILWRLVGANPQHRLILTADGEPEDENLSIRASPRNQTEALGMLKLAALDPNVARILGLYWHDADVEEHWYYDYLIVGYWGPVPYPGTHITFDDLTIGRLFNLPLKHEGLTIAYVGQMEIVSARWEGRIRNSLELDSALLGRPIYLRLDEPTAAATLYLIADADVTIRTVNGDSYDSERSIPAGPQTVNLTGSPLIDGIEIESTGSVQLVEVILRPEAGNVGTLGFISYEHSLDKDYPVLDPVMSKPQRIPRAAHGSAGSALVDAPNAVALSWVAPTSTAYEEAAGIPLSYWVERRTGTSGGDSERLNEGEPAIIPNNAEDNRGEQWKDWPNPIYFADAGLPDGTYEYAVQGIDLFGRLSSISAFEPIELADTFAPPPPRLVGVSYLDPENPLLTSEESALVEAHGAGLRVRWEWPGIQRMQAPDMEAGSSAEFRVYLQRGPLNSITGIVTSVTVGASTSVLRTDQTWGGTADALKGQWIRVGQNFFQVKGNTVGARFRITVANLKNPAVVSEPGRFALTLDRSLAGDFRAPETWQERIHVESVADMPILSGRIDRVDAFSEQGLLGLEPDSDLVLDEELTPGVLVVSGLIYRVIEHTDKLVVRPLRTPASDVAAPAAGASPKEGDEFTYFPGRKYEHYIDGFDLTPADGESTAIAHVGVSASDGKSHVPDDAKWASGSFGGRPGNESAVSVPGKAVNTRRGARAFFPDVDQAAGEEWTYAEPADFYGNAHYTIEWPKQSGAEGYAVYRASGHALFTFDREQRRLRTATDYTDYEFGDDPGFSDWKSENYPDLELDDAFTEVLTTLTNARAKEVLAFWRDWQARFYDELLPSKVEELAGKACNTGAFSRITQDPITTITYRDTFDGRGRGCYVWRVRAIDASCNLSNWSSPLLPVAVCDISSPATPVILSALGGERSITLTWRAGTEDDLVEYRVWRATDELTLQDVRRMEPTSTIPAAPGTTAGALEDSGLLGGTDYFYRLAAVDADGNVSSPTAVVSVRAIDTAPPDPPAFTVSEWQEATGVLGVHLGWDPIADGFQALVERRAATLTEWSAVSAWILSGTDAFDDSSALPHVSYVYRLRVKSGTGLLNSEFIETEVRALYALPD
ncbi:MAG TPA: fibronectin type III domain-containing protein [Phycisphaerae bacterium]|nr:fibronectin type III domain-containing protein [Phycisphaerae bacterium]